MAPASHCTFVHGNFKDSNYPRWMVVVQTNPHLGQHGFASFQGPANGQKVSCDELIKEFWFISDTCNKIADSTFSPKKWPVLYERFFIRNPRKPLSLAGYSSSWPQVWMRLALRTVGCGTYQTMSFPSNLGSPLTVRIRFHRGWRLDSWNLLQRTWC